MDGWMSPVSASSLLPSLLITIHLPLVYSLDLMTEGEPGTIYVRRVVLWIRLFGSRTRARQQVVCKKTTGEGVAEGGREGGLAARWGAGVERVG